MYKAFEHRQFSTHSSWYKAENAYGDIAETDGEGGESGERGGQEKERGGRVCWTARSKIKKKKF